MVTNKSVENVKSILYVAFLLLEFSNAVSGAFIYIY